MKPVRVDTQGFGGQSRDDAGQQRRARRHAWLLGFAVFAFYAGYIAVGAM